LDNNSRVVFFLVSCILVLGISQFFIPAPPPAVNPSKPVSQSGATVTGAITTAADNSGDSGALAPTLKQARPSHIPAASVTIETNEYIAVLSNQGALLTSFQLKKYPNRETHQPIELVNPDVSRLKPFALDYAPLPDLNQALFEVEGTSQTLSGSDEKAQLVFRYVDGTGAVLEKKFGFKNGSYLIDFDATVRQTGKASLPASNLIVQWPDILGRDENTGTSSHRGGFAGNPNSYRVSTLSSGGVDSERAKKSQESSEIPAPISWTSLANQFFAAVLIPDPSSGAASAKIVRDTNAYKVPTDEDPNPGINPDLFNPRPELVFQGQALNRGESFHRKMQVFFGPQEYKLLNSLNLVGVMDLSRYFGFISVYMLQLLQWFDTWCHNWGIAVILLSITVKLLLWLPTHNSYKNMYLTQKKMREVQPKLDALKRKYPDDKQKQQQEQMRLFNEAGINPLGGCLPMLFQMPVFWALYAALNHSIELRGASFLWLSDLTLKDSTYVLPLLMGGSMILQQKVSGQMATQAAGQQKMMMWMMPVMLTFISTKWPAGLLLYWVVTNILSMLQQKIVNREVQKAKKKDEVVKS
jgi:YidC/Oxa1 family membrane protein insertase